MASFFNNNDGHCLFSKTTQDGSPIFLILYMEDMLLSHPHVGELTDLVRQLRLKFSIKDLSSAKHILGIRISRLQNQRQLFLSQTDYIRRVLECFNIQSAKSASTPLPISLQLPQRDCPTSSSKGEVMKLVPHTLIVDSLMHAMVVARPDIAHTAGVASKFMHNLGRSHWNVVKHVFKYLVGIKTMVSSSARTRTHA